MKIFFVFCFCYILWYFIDCGGGRPWLGCQGIWLFLSFKWQQRVYSTVLYSGAAVHNSHFAMNDAWHMENCQTLLYSAVDHFHACYSSLQASRVAGYLADKTRDKQHDNLPTCMYSPTVQKVELFLHFGNFGRSGMWTLMLNNRKSCQHESIWSHHYVMFASKHHCKKCKINCTLTLKKFKIFWVLDA